MAFRRPLGGDVGEPFERVQEGLAVGDAEQRSAQPDLAGDVQEFEGAVVVQQDLVVEVADDYAFEKIAQDRLQLRFLFLDAGGGAGHDLVHVSPGGGQFSGHRADRRGQLAQGLGLSEADLVVGVGVCGRLHATGQGQQRRHQGTVEKGPADGEDRNNRHRRAAAIEDHDIARLRPGGTGVAEQPQGGGGGDRHGEGDAGEGADQENTQTHGSGADLPAGPGSRDPFQPVGRIAGGKRLGDGGVGAQRQHDIGFVFGDQHGHCHSRPPCVAKEALASTIETVTYHASAGGFT